MGAHAFSPTIPSNFSSSFPFSFSWEQERVASFSPSFSQIKWRCSSLFSPSLLGLQVLVSFSCRLSKPQTLSSNPLKFSQCAKPCQALWPLGRPQSPRKGLTCLSSYVQIHLSAEFLVAVSSTSPHSDRRVPGAVCIRQVPARARLGAKVPDPTLTSNSDLRRDHISMPNGNVVIKRGALSCLRGSGKLTEEMSLTFVQ